MPKQNIEVTANAEKTANSYSVVFNENTGTESMPNQGFVYDEEQALDANLFTKEGYHFKCWNTEADGTGTSYENKQVVKNLVDEPNGTITLYAQWQPNEYIIIFNANGGNGEMPNQVFKFDETKLLQNNSFVCPGYTFDGWKLELDGSEIGYGDGEEVSNLTKLLNKQDEQNAEIILYAQWSANSYIVKFNANTGTGTTMLDQTFTYGKEKELSGNKYTKIGYTFAGWATSENGEVLYKNGQVVSNLVTTPNGTITLYAVWTKNNYEVIYNKNGPAETTTGTMENSLFKYDTKENLTANAYSRIGYTFKNWNTKADGTGTSYQNGAEVENLTEKGKVTLYAQWSANTYIINFNENTGNGTMLSQECTYDKGSYLRKNEFTKTGYTFAGWSLVPNPNQIETEEENKEGTENSEENNGNIDYTKIFNDEEQVLNLVAENNGEITLYAQWKANEDTKYTVTHYVKNTSGDFSILEENLKGITDSELILANLVKTTSEYNVPNGIYFKRLKIDGETVAEANTSGEYTENTIQILANKATTIKPDGSLKIEIYYERTYGNLTVVKGDYVEDVFATEGENKNSINNRKFYYGESVPELTATISRQNGHVITFQEWESSNTTFLPSIQANPSGTFIWPAMPANTNITLTAKATKVESDDTQYVVNHYLESPNGAGWTLYKTIDKYGTTNSTITEDMVKIDIPNSKFKESDITGTTISENGDTVVNLWYTRNEYTLKIKGGKNITQIEESTTEGKNVDNQEPISIEKRLKWGADINIEATLENETGYTYEFTGWVTTSTANLGKGYNENNKSTTITMPAEDMEITATASKTANKYKVKFNANTGTGKMEEQEFTYNEPQRLRPNDFKKEGHTFKGWVDAETLSKLNAEPPTLTLEQAMAQGKLYVENETEDGKQGAEVINLTSENGKTINLYAIWKDETAPALTIETTTTTKSIKVDVSAVENGSGLAGNYKYYIGTMQNVSEDGNEDVTQKIVYSEPVEKAETTHTFTELEDDTTYYIKVEKQDKAGNTGVIKDQEVSTNKLEGEVTFSDEYWSNGKYILAVNTEKVDENGDLYKMQYQVLTAEEVVQMKNQGITDEQIQQGEGVQEEKWSKETISSGELLGNGQINNEENLILKDGDILYVRIYDGTNGADNYYSYSIINPAQKTYTEEDLAKLTYGATTFDIMAYEVSPKGFKVDIKREIAGTKMYNYYAKASNENEYKLISTSTNWNDMADVSNELLARTTLNLETNSEQNEALDGKIRLKENETYKVKVLVMSENGTVTQCLNTATMITEEKAEKGVSYEQNRTYIDSKNYTAVIPARFKVSTNTGVNGANGNNGEGGTSQNNSESKSKDETTISTGMVLQDLNGNEFVWVPVNHAKHIEGATAIPNSSSSKTMYYKPMSVKQSGTNYYESKPYNFSGLISYRWNDSYKIGYGGFREPSLLTGNAYDGYTWNISSTIGTAYDVDSNNYLDTLGFTSVNEYGNYTNKEYTNMVTSVDNYGGFYIGRYETSLNGDKVQSKPNQTPMSSLNWYQLYFNEDSNRNINNTYYKSRSVTSSMVWGSQYDSMLNWMITGGEKSGLLLTNIGNKTSTQGLTGAYENDKINNIYDLAANTYEWTQEAYDRNTRIYRGSSYNMIKTENMTARSRSGVPTDQGPAFGTRLTLYINGTESQKAPGVEITSITSTANTIDVQVKAKGSGISKYCYSISTDNENWETHESYSPNYTYMELTQNTTYFIMVQVKDNSGNTGAAETTQINTETAKLEDGAIYIKSKIGSNGNGIMILGMRADYESSGYNIEYNIELGKDAINSGKEQDESKGIYISPKKSEDGSNIEGETDIENGSDIEKRTFIQSDTINELYDGDTIYARLNDGTNITPYTTINVDNLEKFSKIYEENTEYTEIDESGNIIYTATIPKGFAVGVSEGINKISTGLVIQDSEGNQFVWVPVEKALHTDKEKQYPTSKDSDLTYKPMAIYQDNSTNYYQSLIYTFNQGTTASLYVNPNYKLGTPKYREPSVVTGSEYDGYTWDLDSLAKIEGTTYDANPTYLKNWMKFSSVTEYGKYKNEEYKNMIDSVEQYKGFYIGRYETSVEGGVAESQAGKEVLDNSTNDKSGYMAIYYQDSNRNPDNPYSDSSSVTSSMIWNTQWDAMLNWILKTESNKEQVFSLTFGNHKKATKPDLSGYNGEDKTNNIFDLGGNVREVNQGSNSTYQYIIRGGAYYRRSDYTGIASMAGMAQWSLANVSREFNHFGTRMALYLTKDKGSTDPTITKNGEPIKTTNSITVKVNATGDDSGIEKYCFYIKPTGETEYKDEDLKVSWGNSYTFEGLKSGSSYDIKVKVVCKSNESAEITYDEITTLKIDAAEEILNSRIYGSDKDDETGKESNIHVYISVPSEYEQSGYTLEYQIERTGEKDVTTEDLKDDNKWIKDTTGTRTITEFSIGNTKTKLQKGDIIYARIQDANKNKTEANETEEHKSKGYKVITIEKVEEFECRDENENYTYTDGKDTATIPAGFKVPTENSIDSIKTIANGLVVEDPNGNQYVWVPIDKETFVYDNTKTVGTTGEDTYKPAVQYQKGSNENFESIIYTFDKNYETGSKVSYVKNGIIEHQLGSSANREPSLITGSTENYDWNYSAGGEYDTEEKHYKEICGFESAEKMGAYMNEQYTEMVKSVQKYGGFYIGRFETSLDSSKEVVQSKLGVMPMAATKSEGNLWYGEYYKQESKINENNPYNNSKSPVVSSMIWGSQYDSMLNWVLTGKDKDVVYERTGNHSGGRKATGTYGVDVMNNIFDLSANQYEWTQEANWTNVRVLRGGYYSTTFTYVAWSRGHSNPAFGGASFGSRLVLYIRYSEP